MANKVFIGLIAFLVVVCGILGYLSANLNGRINTLNDDTQAFKADTAGQFTTVKSNISSVDSSLTNFKTDTTNKFTGVQNDITGVQNSVTSLNSDLSTFKSDTTTKLNSAQSSINSLNSNVTDIGTQLDESTLNARSVFDDVIGSVCFITGPVTGGIAGGSGFIYRVQGQVTDIVTCWHVVDGMNPIYVELHDGSVVTASVVGSDRDSDVAVIEISGISNLKPLPLADSSTLVAGQPVIAIGNPNFIFETVVYGVISRLQNMGDVGGVGWVPNLIQYDAATNPGNSGGPVFNSEGQVIGITESGYTSVFQCINFAVSSNKIKRVADTLIDRGFFSTPMLPGNWTFYDLTPELAIERGLDSAFGCIFTDVSGMTGVQANDVIIAVDGIAIRDAADLFSYLTEFKSPGDIVKLTLIRGAGTHVEASLTLIKGWLQY